MWSYFPYRLNAFSQNQILYYHKPRNTSIFYPYRKNVDNTASATECSTPISTLSTLIDVEVIF